MKVSEFKIDTPRDSHLWKVEKYKWGIIASYAYLNDFIINFPNHWEISTSLSWDNLVVNLSTKEAENENWGKEIRGIAQLFHKRKINISKFEQSIGFCSDYIYPKEDNTFSLEFRVTVQTADKCDIEWTEITQTIKKPNLVGYCKELMKSL